MTLSTSRNRQSVYVCGPQGCGKTFNAKRIAEHFGLLAIIDEDLPKRLPVYNTLILSNKPLSPNLRGVLRYYSWDDLALFGLVTLKQQINGVRYNG